MGIALYSFHEHPYETAIAMADSAKVRYVEGFSFYKMGPSFNDSSMGNLDSQGINRIRQTLQERHITMSSMYVANPGNVNGWKKYFELGVSLGLEYLVCEPAKADWDTIDSLAGIYKIKIAIHEHARGSSDYWHPDSVLAAIKGHSNIGTCADLGHWARSGLDVVACLKKLEGHIIGIHVKDINELNNPKAMDVNPGKGVIDYPAVIIELKRQHFNGYLNVECEHNMNNNLPDVKNALDYIQQLSTKQDK